MVSILCPTTVNADLLGNLLLVQEIPSKAEVAVEINIHRGFDKG